jgi:hypothetical protein
MTLKEIWFWLSFSFIPFAISLILNIRYVSQYLLGLQRSTNFDRKKLNRLNTWRQVFLFLALPLSLILLPIINHTYKELYARHQHDISRAFSVGQDQTLSYSEKLEKLENENIFVHAPARPIDIPDTWYAM